MSDIVERLRDTVTMLAVTPMNLSLEDWDRHANAIQDAAAEITKLRAALEELVGAVADPTSQKSIPLALRSARATLAEEKPND